MIYSNEIQIIRNFPVDKRNKFAHDAALAIVNDDTFTFNPVLFYGGRYEGKTILLKAIKNDYGKKYPEKEVIYVTSEAFFSEFMAVYQKDNPSLVKSFRKKYRGADVLLIDDIDFFMNKRLAANELLYTFEELYLKGKQIIFTADRRPDLLGALDDRFRKRLEMGLVVSMRH